MYTRDESPSIDPTLTVTGTFVCKVMFVDPSIGSIVISEDATNLEVANVFASRSGPTAVICICAKSMTTRREFRSTVT